MIETAKNIALLLSALFPIVNPLGGSPIFLSVTGDYTRPERMALARRIAFNSALLLIGSYLIGTHILAFFGISLPVVQVGGGLIVISMGWSMLRRREPEEKKEVQRNLQPQDTFKNAFFPLTFPLTVGPGSISVAITLGANAPHEHVQNLIVGGVASVLLALSILLCYGFADRLAQMLGATAMSVILQLSAFLLVCIGVQILWNGASALLAALPAHPR